MLKSTVLNGNRNVALRLIEHRMADVAIRPDHLAAIAEMLAVVTAEAAQIVIVADVIGVCAPVNLHLWENIGLKNSLYFGDSPFD